MGGDDQVVVAGIGETPVGKLPGRRPVQIQAQAATAAARDAGVALADVDGLVNLDPYAEPNAMFAVTLAEHLGLRPSWVSTVDVGGSVSTMALLQQAEWAIRAGHCSTVLCVYGENMLTGRPPDVRGAMITNRNGGEEWEEPWGIQGMVIPYALVAQRWMHERGGTAEDLGAVAVTTRAHAALNENALLRRPITMADYLASPVLSTPFRLLDCSAIADGAGALLVTTADRARALGMPAVAVRGFAMAASHNSIALQPDLDDLTLEDVGRRAFDQAGIGPDDVHVATLHDAFTLSVLLTLEGLGFCPPGGSGELVRSGATSLGGRCPVNPHGGLLSQGHVGGMLHLVECVRQLQGRAGKRQVPDARWGLVAGNGGVFSVCGSMVLEAVA